MEKTLFVLALILVGLILSSCAIIGPIVETMVAECIFEVERDCALASK